MPRNDGDRVQSGRRAPARASAVARARRAGGERRPPRAGGDASRRPRRGAGARGGCGAARRWWSPPAATARSPRSPTACWDRPRGSASSRSAPPTCWRTNSALPFAPRAVAAALAFGRTRPLWPGVARGADGSRLFVQMLGVGFDAQVVHRLPRAAEARVRPRRLRRCRRCASWPATASRRSACASTARRRRPPASSSARAGCTAAASCWHPTRAPAEPGFSVVLFDHAGRPPRCCMAPRCRSTCWAARPACGTCGRGGSISSATADAGPGRRRRRGLDADQRHRCAGADRGGHRLTNRPSRAAHPAPRLCWTRRAA